MIVIPKEPIVLTPAEMSRCIEVGVRRQMENLRDRLRDAHGAETDRGWQYHIEGALGEYALGRVINMPWTGRTKRGEPDYGDDIDAKTMSYAGAGLPIHPRDRDDWRYWLLTGVNGVYRVRGWCWGHEVKHPQYWGDPAGTKRPAFWMPQRSLKGAAEWDEGRRIVVPRRTVAAAVDTFWDAL